MFFLLLPGMRFPKVSETVRAQKLFRALFARKREEVTVKVESNGMQESDTIVFRNISRTIFSEVIYIWRN